MDQPYILDVSAETVSAIPRISGRQRQSLPAAERVQSAPPLRRSDRERALPPHGLSVFACAVNALPAFHDTFLREPARLCLDESYAPSTCVQHGPYRCASRGGTAGYRWPALKLWGPLPARSGLSDRAAPSPRRRSHWS